MSIIAEYHIRQIFQQGWESFSSCTALFPDQEKAAHAIMGYKIGSLGFSVSKCQDYGHLEIHNNSCRNHSCPNCQALQNEI